MGTVNRRKSAQLIIKVVHVGNRKTKISRSKVDDHINFQLHRGNNLMTTKGSLSTERAWSKTYVLRQFSGFLRVSLGRRQAVGDRTISTWPARVKCHQRTGRTSVVCRLGPSGGSIVRACVARDVRGTCSRSAHVALSACHITYDVREESVGSAGNFHSYDSKEICQFYD
jgi:hypothetical protein